MKNVYVIRLGNLYYKERELIRTYDYRYKMTESINDAMFSENFDGMKKIAEEIGGKIYKINIEEMEADD